MDTFCSNDFLGFYITCLIHFTICTAADLLDELIILLQVLCHFHAVRQKSRFQNVLHLRAIGSCCDYTSETTNSNMICVKPLFAHMKLMPHIVATEPRFKHITIKYIQSAGCVGAWLKIVCIPIGSLLAPFDSCVKVTLSRCTNQHIHTPATLDIRMSNWSGLRECEKDRKRERERIIELALFRIRST